MPNWLSGSEYVARSICRKLLIVSIMMLAWASLLFTGVVPAKPTSPPVANLQVLHSNQAQAGTSLSATPSDWAIDDPVLVRGLMTAVPELLAETELTVEQTPGLPISPDRGKRDAGNWEPVVGNIGRFGLEAGWSLFGFTHTLAGRFTSPDVQLLSLFALLGVLTLIWNHSPGRRPRNYQSGEQAADFSHLDTASDEGVAITCDDSITTIDVDDLVAYDDSESPDSSPADGNADAEGPNEQDVDLITQSEVYLAYGRHKQAVEVLLEEYVRPDGDKFVAASHLINAYRKMGETPWRNTCLGQFIDTINGDIERFSVEEWDSLQNGLDELGQDEMRQGMRDSTSIIPRSAAAG